MKVIIQRVMHAKVTTDGQTVSTIKKGVLTLLGIAKGDDEIKLRKAISKICDLRIFEDEAGKMNLSLKDIHGEHLIVSQFTLLGNCSKGNRPSFMEAELPERAKELYDKALALSKESGIPTRGGQFGAHMEVSLVNDGPVTLSLEF